jgi:hypothetical protein
MFLIKLKMVGNCIVSDLMDKNGNSLILYNGNDRIIDLEEDFSEEQIKNSMKHPDGDLKNLLDNNIIERVNPNSNEYRKQLRDQAKKDLEERCKSKVADKHTVDEVVGLLSSLEDEECHEILTYKYFDNLSVLNKIINSDIFNKATRILAKELIDQHLNDQIDQKFVLI